MDGMTLRKRFALSSLGTVMCLAAVAAPAAAAPPANDDRGAATVVAGLPYHDSVDTSEATHQPDDPDCFSDDGPTVWYSFTPSSDGRYVANTSGSDYDTTLHVGVRDGSGGVELIDCNDDWMDLTSRVLWRASAGREYLLMVGGFGAANGGQLEFNLRHAPPPPPDPTVSLWIKRRAGLSDGGGLIVRGSVQCEPAGRGARLYVRARQDWGRHIIRGGAAKSVPCGKRWKVAVWDDALRFGPGPVRVRATAWACNRWTCVSQMKRRTVTAG